MLSRQFRLVKETDFARVYRQGKRVSSGSLAVFFRLRKSDQRGSPVSRFGFVVSKKYAGRIADRNKLKRRMRAVVRSHLERISGGYDVVISAKPQLKSRSAGEQEQELTGLLKRSNLIKAK